MDCSKFQEREKDQTPANDAEHFFLAIYADRDWKIVNSICNQAKHEGHVPNLDAEYGLRLSSWGLVSDVRSFSNGPPSKFTVDGQDIEPILERVIDFYRRNWFQKTASP